MIKHQNRQALSSHKSDLARWRASLTGYGIFHLFDLGSAMHAQGRLEKVYTASDLLRTLKHKGGVPFRRCSFDWLPPKLRGKNRQIAASGRMARGVRSDKSTVIWSMPRSATSAFSAAPNSLKILDIDHVNWNPSVAGRVASLDLTRFEPSSVLPPSIPNQSTRLAREYDAVGLRFEIEDEQIVDELRECQMADVLVVPVSYVRDSLIAIGFPEDRIRLIHYGYDPTIFFPNQARYERANSDSMRILVPGSISVRKGWRHLKEIIRRVTKNSNVKISLAGGIEPRLNSDVRGFVAEFSESVNYEGRLSKSKLADLMRKSDVAIYPSVFEGFGFTVLQSLACGLPVVTTPATVGADLVRPGENGYIFEFDEYDRWSERMVELESDRGKLRSMRIAAAESVKDLTWERYLAEIDAIVSEIA